MSKPLRHRIRPQVVLLGVAAMLNDISSDMIFPLLPLFLAGTLGAAPLLIGLIEGSADTIGAFLKLISGYVSDRMPRRKPLVAGGYATASVARLIVALAGSWPVVLAGRLLDRTGKGIRTAPRDAMICDVTPVEDRGRAFGLHRALDHTGAVFGPLIAAALLGWFHLPFRTIFLIAVIPSAVGVLMLFLFLKERRTEPMTPQRLSLARGPLPAPFWSSLLPILVFYLANSSDVYLILRARDAGVATAWIPLLWAAHHAVKALFSTHAGALSDRMDRRWMLAAGWTIYAGVYLIFPLSSSRSTFLILFIVYAFPFALTEGAERAWISIPIRSELRGKAFGIYAMTAGLGTLAGTALFGWLWERFTPTTAFHAGAGLALAAAVLLFLRPGAGNNRSTTAV